MRDKELIVQRVPIITSSTVVFAVYEKTESPLGGGHSTITTFDDRAGWYGRLGTRRLPAIINEIPVGEERFETVRGWARVQHDEAYRAILTVFPELLNEEKARFDHGEVSLDSGRRNGAGDSSTFAVVDRDELVDFEPELSGLASKKRGH